MWHGDRRPVTSMRSPLKTDRQPNAAMDTLEEFAREKLAELDRAHLRRALTDTRRTESIWVVQNGRKLLSFSCNDYLNLAQHPAVKAAAIQAIEQHGVG